MEPLGWVIAGVLLLWYFAQMNLHKKRLHLRNYNVYLLLSDRIRTNHRNKFEQWIRDAEVRGAFQLSTLARRRRV